MCVCVCVCVCERERERERERKRVSARVNGSLAFKFAYLIRSKKRDIADGIFKEEDTATRLADATHFPQRCYWVCEYTEAKGVHDCFFFLCLSIRICFCLIELLNLSRCC